LKENVSANIGMIAGTPFDLMGDEEKVPPAVTEKSKKL